MNIQNIPKELKKLKQWCCWAGDKLPKNPYTGGNAQSNNPDTWSDFETAVSSIGKTIFFTKSEAEEKLKGLKEQK